MGELGAAADAAWNSGALAALKEAVAAQGRPSGVKWTDALSASVRPVITDSFRGLYSAVKVAAYVAAINGGLTWLEALPQAWMEADQALWAGVLNYWFLGRVF